MSCGQVDRGKLAWLSPDLVALHPREVLGLWVKEIALSLVVPAVFSMERPWDLGRAYVSFVTVSGQGVQAKAISVPSPTC